MCAGGAAAAAQVGENCQLRRVGGLAVEEGGVFKYLHNALGDDSGKLAVRRGRARRPPPPPPSSRLGGDGRRPALGDGALRSRGVREGGPSSALRDCSFL